MLDAADEIEQLEKERDQARESNDTLNARLLKCEAALVRLLHEIDELSVKASDHIQPDEENKPWCGCCGSCLETADIGHRNDCMAQGVLDLWHAVNQAKDALKP